MSCCGDKSKQTIHPGRGAVKPSGGSDGKDWPGWARGVATLRRKEDAGVGDTVHRMIGDTASEVFAKWHLRLFKTPCGCPERRAEWNKLYPYGLSVAKN